MKDYLNTILLLIIIVLPAKKLCSQQYENSHKIKSCTIFQRNPYLLYEAKVDTGFDIKECLSKTEWPPKIKKWKVIKKTNYDNNGNKIKEFIDDEEDWVFYREFKYDDKKNLIEVSKVDTIVENWFSEHGSSATSSGKITLDPQPKFDSVGVAIEIEEYYDFTKHSYKYNNNNKIIEEINGNNRIVYLYNQNNTLIQKNLFDQEGKLISTEKYLYNDKNRLTKIEIFTDEYKINEKYLYFMDEYGFKKKELQFIHKGTENKMLYKGKIIEKR